MASLRRFSNVIQSNLSLMRRYSSIDNIFRANKCIKNMKFRTKFGLMLSMVPVVSASNDSKSRDEKLKMVDPEKLTSSYLLKNSAAANVDTAITLLNQTVSTFLDLQGKYLNTINQLLRLQELVVDALGNTKQEEIVWDAVLVTRKEINDIKAAIIEMEYLLGCTERLVNNASEAAFLTGAEYMSSVASERLHAAQEKIKTAKAEKITLESAIAKKEKWVIEKTAEHADKEEKKEKEPKDKTNQSDKSSDDSSLTNKAMKNENPEINVTNLSDFQQTTLGDKDWFDVVFEQTNQNDGENSHQTTSSEEDMYSHFKEKFSEEKEFKDKFSSHS